MAYENNDYVEFVRELELDQLSDLSDIMTCAGREGTPLEGIVKQSVIEGRVDIIPRGKDSILLYDRHRQERVWVNRNTTSEQVFLDVLHGEINHRISPFCDLPSYYTYMAQISSDD